jgi:hypothetical protein
MKRQTVAILVVLTCTRAASAQEVPSACAAQDDAGSVSSFVDCARAATERYHDQANATLDGYRVIGRDFPAMGEHWINVSLLFDGRFDAAHPEVLTYTVVAGVPRLLGVAYALPLLAGEAPPDWPPGADAWHDHARTIEQETVLSQHDGHDHRIDTARIAMMHAWIWTENPAGMFAADNWTIPFLRVGLAMPVDSPPAAAKAISLVVGGLEYVSTMIDVSGAMPTSERRAVAEMVSDSQTAVRTILAARSGSPLTSEDVEALVAIWSSLSAGLDHRIDPRSGDQPKLVQTANRQPAKSVESPEEVARSMMNQNRIVAVPAPKGKVKHGIDKAAPTYSFISGQSPAVLFRLPEYRGPYELLIFSLCNCLGFSKSIFVPSGAFLDDTMQQTHDLPEVEFQSHSGGMKAYNVEATIVIGDERKADRFLLLYTRGDAAGERQGRVTTLMGGAAAAIIPLNVKRALNGTLELETRPTR